jgi:hypothetical protein
MTSSGLAVWPGSKACERHVPGFAMPIVSLRALSATPSHD